MFGFFHINNTSKVVKHEGHELKKIDKKEYEKKCPHVGFLTTRYPILNETFGVTAYSYEDKIKKTCNFPFFYIFFRVFKNVNVSSFVIFESKTLSFKYVEL